MKCMHGYRIFAAAALFAAALASPMTGWSRDGAPGPGESAFIQRFDQDGDGLVCEDEFPGSLDHFQSLDLDGDGYLDAAETPERPPHGMPGPEELLAEFDADGDGQLSADEFPGPAGHFDDLDADGDGFLNQEELLAGRPGPPEGGGFENDDTDQDGRVSLEEFSAVRCKAHPCCFHKRAAIPADRGSLRRECRKYTPRLHFPGPAQTNQKFS